MANSTNVIIDNINMKSVSSDSNPNKNTDGIGKILSPTNKELALIPYRYIQI
jgi:hypothetical protein